MSCRREGTQLSEGNESVDQPGGRRLVTRATSHERRLLPLSDREQADQRGGRQLTSGRPNCRESAGQKGEHLVTRRALNGQEGIQEADGWP